MNTPVTSVVQGFWLATCGFNTHHLGSNYAQHETPWNQWSRNGILVATVWEDEIVDVPTPSGVRRFIILGGKMGAWEGPAIRHGRDAELNMDRALRQRGTRIVGYEASPALVDGTRRVKKFHMDRVHELVPVFALNPLIEQYGLLALLQAKNPELATAQRLGTVFELTQLAGTLPSPVAPPVVPVAIGEDYDPVTVGRMADLALPLLIRHVREQPLGLMQVMTYGQLANAIGWLDKNGRGHARGVGAALKEVMHRIDAAGLALGALPPLLTAVVVAASGANAGLPEAGIDERWPGYVDLQTEEKRTRVLLEYDRIIAYGPGWNLLLDYLGFAQTPGLQCGGGESPAHKALKQYVLDNPHRFGIERQARGSVEYALKSGDSIDVFFSSCTQWTGIEVKSRVSDGMPADYERGIYQIVKYRAVLVAQAAEHRKPPTVRVLLVLESAMPEQYKELAKRLSVDFIEHCTPSTAS